MIDSMGGTLSKPIEQLPRDAIELADLQLLTRRSVRNQARADSIAARQFAGPTKLHPTIAAMACDDAFLVLATSGNVSKGAATWRLLDWAGRETMQD